MLMVQQATNAGFTRLTELQQTALRIVMISAAAAAADTRAESGPVHRLSDNVYVTSVVFDEPFAYSTSNWVKGQQTSLLTALNLYTEGF
jgi:hypothetical protein